MNADLLVERLQWNLIFKFSSIFAYSATQTSTAAYIIGGYYTPDVVAEYKDGQWRQRGNLYRGRAFHGAITIGVQTMIIGGIDPFFKHEPSSMQPEIWKLDNSAYKIIQPIGVYSDGVALFEVDANFCKKNTGKSLRLHVSCDFDK